MLTLLIIALVVTLIINVFVFVFIVATFIRYLRVSRYDYTPTKDEWKQTD